MASSKYDQQAEADPSQQNSRGFQALFDDSQTQKDLYFSSPSVMKESSQTRGRGYQILNQPINLASLDSDSEGGPCNSSRSPVAAHKRELLNLGKAYPCFLFNGYGMEELPQMSVAELKVRRKLRRLKGVNMRGTFIHGSHVVSAGTDGSSRGGMTRTMSRQMVSTQMRPENHHHLTVTRIGVPRRYQGRGA